jgi:methionine biosynthesis protein MetW
MANVYGRRDFAIIGDLIEPKTRVLDLGCGEGELLAWLKENKKVDGRGVEMEGARVQKAIARGASVYQGDLESAVEDYPDQAFDYVVLSQTLQETRYPLAVLRGMLRVGKRAIVAFPNFGHYSVRLAWLLSGRAPRTDRFPYDWYDSPNIHFLSVLDFEALAEKQGWKVERRICVAGERQVTWLPNLMAEIAVFEVSADPNALLHK